MSRSFKKTPIHGAAGVSDKPGKVSAHRAYRSNVKRQLRHCEDYDDLVLRPDRLIGDVWDMPKDGKVYWSRASAIRRDNAPPVGFFRLLKQPTGWEESWKKAMRK